MAKMHFKGEIFNHSILELGRYSSHQGVGTVLERVRVLGEKMFLSSRSARGVVIVISCR